VSQPAYKIYLTVKTADGQQTVMDIPAETALQPLAHLLRDREIDEAVGEFLRQVKRSLAGRG